MIKAPARFLWLIFAWPNPNPAMIGLFSPLKTKSQDKIEDRLPYQQK
jgi:hypothetical protein